MKQVLPLNPASYRRHAIHSGERIWAETNCYADVWIELLYALDLEPIAALAFTLAIDCEGDQWTFFKFPLADLYTLYGLDVQELAIWRPLTTHIDEQLSLGQFVLVELDSFHLPDTAGTAYQREHVKTTVAVNMIDLAAKRLGYFHSQGYFELGGADYDNVFRIPGLPPYVEFVKRRRPALAGRELIEASLRTIRHQLGRLPTSNPFAQYKTRFQADLAWLSEQTIDVFHLYSFSTLRQFGACYELAWTFLRWLEGQSGLLLQDIAEAFRNLSNGAKTLQFQLARAMARKKAMDLTPLDGLAATWQFAIDRLKATFS